MSFNLFAQPLISDIRVGYIDPTLGYVDDVTICEANNYAKDNPGTTFIFRNGDNNLLYLNINEVNNLTTGNLVSTANTCGGIQQYKECGPPRIQFFGGGGIGAVGNPVIGRDGSLLAVDVVRGGYGYQYPPLVAAKDDCQFGNGAILTAILGETPDQTEVYEGEEDFEEYEICEDTDVGYGIKYGTDGQPVGEWDPRMYTRVGEDPIKREIEIYQKALEKPFWNTRKTKPILVTAEGDTYPDPFVATHPEWGEFMNKYAVSPIKPTSTPGTDEAAKTFIMEWEENFPISGEYIFRGTCDNISSVYIDDQLVGKLQSFKENPIPLQKTIQEGNHKIKVELYNSPIYTTVTTKVDNNITFTISGRGSGNLYFTFTSEDGKDSFTLFGPKATQSKNSKTQVVNIRPNVTYKVVSGGSAGGFKYREQGLLSSGNNERGVSTSNKIFADYIGSANDNNDLIISASDGLFTSSNKREYKGRSTYDLTYRFDKAGYTGPVTQKVISPQSWDTNPIGVSLSIDAPFPNIPQETPPPQLGKCPNNPIWTTRFPGSTQRWYPVRYTKGNAWSKFMNRYAISPVLPLNDPGSDKSGITFTNSWTIDAPYAGFYGIRGTRDNRGRLLIDGEEVSTLDGFNVTNPSLRKKYLTKGKHTITVEVFNTPLETKFTVDRRIFTTQDWRAPLTAGPTTQQTANLSAKFVKQGASFYLQVDGTGSGKISFVMDVNDKSYIAGLAAKEVYIPSDSGKIKFVRKGAENNLKVYGFDYISAEETINQSGTFTGGKKYGPIEIIGAGAGARGPVISSSNRLGIRDAEGDDENIKITIGKIEPGVAAAPTPTTPGSTTITKNGITYEGPALFGYKDSRWSKYMNEFSVSPNFSGSAETFVLKWKGVNFPQSGTYKFNFQADNIATLKIGGTQIAKTTDFIGEKVQYTFDISAGTYNIVIELENVKSQSANATAAQNPAGVALYISKDIVDSDTSITPWTDNPMAVSAILIPPPCAKKIGGKGVVQKVLVDDPGNGFLPPQGDGYPVTLILDEVIVENPGINYSCGEDKIQIVPDNGAVLDYDCDPFGKIKSVKVLNPGVGFNIYPSITIPSETGVNASFRPVFRVVRDPLLPPEKIIQVTDLVGLKQTGYVDGRAYYGAIYYDEGVAYAGYYKTAGTQVRVYATLQESITAQVTTPASAIQRSGTDIRSNDPRLNIPGTPESTSGQA